MAKSESLIQRLLNTRDLAQIVPRLEPEALHRVIQVSGLEDCADLLALVTPGQLTRILDLDIWHADEEFDAERFGLWLSVLMQAGAAVAAEKLTGLELELVVEGLANHAAVFECGAVSAYSTLDGEYVDGRSVNHGPALEIGGYVVEARRTSAWDAIVELLPHLEAEHREYFHHVMSGCVQLSNGTREEDGSHDLLPDEQHLLELAGAREARRERQGYVTAAQAHAFLEGARNIHLDDREPPSSATARAYFRALEPLAAGHLDTLSEPGSVLRPASGEGSSEPAPGDTAVVVEILREAGILTAGPAALLGSGERQKSRLAPIRAHLTSNEDGAEQLAYLANTIAAGCPVLGRPFTLQEAADAAVAIANLGLENWPAHWSARDLVTAFQVGWTRLHREVCMSAAEHLADALAPIQCSDRRIHLRLRGLRSELTRHVEVREPWRVRGALDVLLELDGPSWAALRALIAECPVLPAAIRDWRNPGRAVDPAAFEFISENSQIACVHEFLTLLPVLLTR